MELTEEQRERIRINRERALAIQQQRKKEKEEQELALRRHQPDVAEATMPPHNVTHHDHAELRHHGTKSHQPTGDTSEEKSNLDEMEEWEYHASPYVTKQEAKTVYCLPEGTISCCHVIMEKENPKHKMFSQVKLYSRTEIRARSYRRYGGLVGLQQERMKRQQSLHEKHLQQAQQIFSNPNANPKKKKKHNDDYYYNNPTIQSSPSFVSENVYQVNKKQKK